MSQEEDLKSRTISAAGATDKPSKSGFQVDEASALGKLLRVMDALDPAVRERMLLFLNHRYARPAAAFVSCCGGGSGELPIA